MLPESPSSTAVSGRLPEFPVLEYYNWPLISSLVSFACYLLGYLFNPLLTEAKAKLFGLL